MLYGKNDQFTHQLRNRLKTAGMGLGLVRLLMDSRRTEEARMALASIQNGFQYVAEASETPMNAVVPKGTPILV